MEPGIEQRKAKIRPAVEKVLRQVRQTTSQPAKGQVAPEVIVGVISLGTSVGAVYVVRGIDTFVKHIKDRLMSRPDEDVSTAVDAIAEAVAKDPNIELK